jgi:hypothetical protein
VQTVIRMRGFPWRTDRDEIEKVEFVNVFIVSRLFVA